MCLHSTCSHCPCRWHVQQQFRQHSNRQHGLPFLPLLRAEQLLQNLLLSKAQRQAPLPRPAADPFLPVLQRAPGPHLHQQSRLQLQRGHGPCGLGGLLQDELRLSSCQIFTSTHKGSSLWSRTQISTANRSSAPSLRSYTSQKVGASNMHYWLKV